MPYNDKTIPSYDSINTNRVVFPIRKNTEKTAQQAPSAAKQRITVQQDESPIEAEEIGRENINLEPDRETILKGIVYSEILGKPKSKK